jgi:hypothetical protein
MSDELLEFIDQLRVVLTIVDEVVESVAFVVLRFDVAMNSRMRARMTEIAEATGEQAHVCVLIGVYFQRDKLKSESTHILRLDTTLEYYLFAA